MRVGGLIRGLFAGRQAHRGATDHPGATIPDRPSRLGTPASDLFGTTPDGSPAHRTTNGGRLALLFLTSSCYDCQVLWHEPAASPLPVNDPTVHPPSARPVGDPTADRSIVIVTPSASTESARRVAALASPGIPVVMSSDSWHAYGVTKAPWCVVVSAGIVVADGPAPSTWDEVETLVGRAG